MHHDWHTPLWNSLEISESTQLVGCHREAQVFNIPFQQFRDLYYILVRREVSDLVQIAEDDTSSELFQRGLGLVCSKRRPIGILSVAQDVNFCLWNELAPGPLLMLFIPRTSQAVPASKHPSKHDDDL